MLNKLKSITLIALAILFAASCRNDHGENQISIQYDWILNMNFCGEILAEKYFDDKYGISIVHNIGGIGIDPIKMVLSGVSDVGIASLEKVLMANEKGADLVVFAVANHIAPTVFLTLGSDTLNSPSDFEGKSIGLAPGSSTEFIYRALIKIGNLDAKKIEEIPADFDIKGFIEGIYEIRPAYIYVEPIDLELNNITFNLFEPRNWGIKYPGRVYFVKRDFIEQNEELLKKFTYALAEGWKKTKSDNDLAIQELLKENPSLDTEREILSLQLGGFYLYGYSGQVLTVDSRILSDFGEDMIKIGLIDDKSDIETAIDLTFVNDYHEQQKD
ncbi:MAG: ABC transporter substrate-binding protein [Cyclobacteriaceae bacterium]